ncbi:hypothetical protein IIB79_10380, partial [candidate division KSB1 bacterium]|nr:hypothetical protein [candidate division KSB1 bacterium]
MKKKTLYCLVVTAIMFSVSFLDIIPVYAGSKSMVAGKREKFKDDSVDSMKNLFEKREAKSKAYKEKMMS